MSQQTPTVTFNEETGIQPNDVVSVDGEFYRIVRREDGQMADCAECCFSSIEDCADVPCPWDMVYKKIND